MQSSVILKFLRYSIEIAVNNSFYLLPYFAWQVSFEPTLFIVNFSSFISV
ncbi:MAG: hypothetical protein LBL65_04410 [Campylobacteraceae bacterium]|nr:hypothetical protein [Campylobacteraceae bacterium]